jgi:hypothetical protein
VRQLVSLTSCADIHRGDIAPHSETYGSGFYFAFYEDDDLTDTEYDILGDSTVKLGTLKTRRRNVTFGKVSIGEC